MTGQDDDNGVDALKEQSSKAENYPMRYRESRESIRFTIDPKSGHPGMYIPRSLAARADFEERFMWMMEGYYGLSNKPLKTEH